MAYNYKIFLVLSLLRIWSQPPHLVARPNGLELVQSDRLDIDTSIPLAKVTRFDHSVLLYNMTFERGNITGPDGTLWPYTTAVLSLDGDLTLQKGAIINITGLHGLSIRTLRGSIAVNSSIDMTCETNATGLRWCLGGYAPRMGPLASHHAIVPGSGPGMNHAESAIPFIQNDQCMEGAGHGGKGGAAKSFAGKHVGWYYGRRDIHHLIGGSTGSYKNPNFASNASTSRPGSGGGAIELRADNGRITISSPITASAQILKGPLDIHSGSSGGTIRLKAREVYVTGEGRLQVDGGPAGRTRTKWPGGLAGGAGGVVQIIADSGVLVSNAISMSSGAGNGCQNNSNNEAESGFLLIRDFSGNFSKSWNDTEMFPATADYTWNTVRDENTSASQSILPSGQFSPTSAMSRSPTSASEVVVPLTCTPVEPHGCTSVREPSASRSIEQDVNAKLSTLHKRATYIKAHVNMVGNAGSMNDLMSLIREFHQLINITIMTGPQIGRCIKLMETLMDIHAIIASKTTLYTKPMATSLCLVADYLLDKRNKAAWIASLKLPALLDIVEKIAVNTAKASTTESALKLEFIGSHVLLQIVSYPYSAFRGIAMPMFRDQLRLVNSNMEHADLPRDVVAPNNGNITVSIQVYQDVEELFPTTLNGKIRSNKTRDAISHVITCSIIADNQGISRLNAPVVLHFKSANVGESRPVCVYWNKTQNSWASDGVTLSMRNSTHVQCRTRHLTSFAVLTQFTAFKIPAKHVLALDVITYIGCGTSIAALFITLLVFSAFESLSSDRHNIHLNLTLAIIMSQILFLVGINATKHEILCRIIAVVLHYLFSASFTWMCIEGFHLYMKVVTVFRTDNIKLKYYYAFGWGFPVIIVGIAASVDSTGYGTPSACWLSMENGFIWAFLGPVVAIILVNLVILLLVVKIVVSSAAVTKGTELRQVKAGLKGALLLLPLLGVTWVFGLLAISRNTIAFQYAFALSNSLQGLFIFLFHCIGNNEVRAAIRRFCQRHTQTSDLQSTFSPSVSNSNVETLQPSTPKRKRVQKLKEKAALTLHQGSHVTPLKESHPEIGVSESNRVAFSCSAYKNKGNVDMERETNDLNCPLDVEKHSDVEIKDSPGRRSSVTRRSTKSTTMA